MIFIPITESKMTIDMKEWLVTNNIDFQWQNGQDIGLFGEREFVGLYLEDQDAIAFKLMFGL